METLATRSFTNLRKIDEKERTAEFMFSSGKKDRHGTIIPPENWDLTNYEKNPIVGYQHSLYDSTDPDDVIGRTVKLWTDSGLMGRIKFEEGNPKADKLWNKVNQGFISSVSVGFTEITPGYWIDEDDVYVFGLVELLEVSIVNIPSDVDATQRTFEELKKRRRSPFTSGANQYLKEAEEYRKYKAIRDYLNNPAQYQPLKLRR